MSISGSSISSATISAPPLERALVYLTADATGNYSSDTVMSYTSEQEDSAGFHDNSTNPTRLTVPSGITKVRLLAQVHVTNVSVDQDLFVDFKKNGSLYQAAGSSMLIVDDPAFTGRFGQLASAPLTVTAGDYFEIQFKILTDTSTTIKAGSNWFMIEEVRS